MSLTTIKLPVQLLDDVSRCPHCGAVSPDLILVDADGITVARIRSDLSHGDGVMRDIFVALNTHQQSSIVLERMEMLGAVAAARELLDA